MVGLVVEVMRLVVRKEGCTFWNVVIRVESKEVFGECLMFGVCS